MRRTTGSFFTVIVRRDGSAKNGQRSAYYIFNANSNVASSIFSI